MSSALHYKRTLLKNVTTPTKNKEHQIVGAATITCNDGTMRPTFSRVEIHGNYNRVNKVIVMSPPKILTVIKTKINGTTIKNVLKITNL